ELQIPQMTGDHWFDATRDYMAVSNIDIPVSENITKKIDLGYIPGTLDFGRFLRGKMAHIFITKPRRSYGYVLSHLKRGLFSSFIDGAFTTIGLVHFISETTFSHFFDLNHFSY